MKTIDEVMGSHMKAARKARSLTLQELSLAVRPGVQFNHSKISKLERGKMIWTVRDLLILLEALGMERAVVSVDSLPGVVINEG